MKWNQFAKPIHHLFYAGPVNGWGQMRMYGFCLSKPLHLECHLLNSLRNTQLLEALHQRFPTNGLFDLNQLLNPCSSFTGSDVDIVELLTVYPPSSLFYYFIPFKALLKGLIVWFSKHIGISQKEAKIGHRRW